MAFNHVKIVGNGIAQNAVVNTATTEAVVHNLVAYNTTGGALEFSLLIDGVSVITESVSANGSYRLPDKVNVPVNATLSINAPTGVDITVSYLQQAIDVSAALTAVQQAAADAGALASSWATTTDAAVADGEYSAKEYAVGTTVPVGSAKEWATTPKNVLVDGVDYSAKHWAETAQDHVASIPAGSINDVVTATDSTWSSQKVQAEIDTKQDTLVSGTSIKTVNGESVLGAGDIALPTANNATITVQGSNGLTGSASFTTNQATNETITLSHADTSTQASVNNSGATVIQDITLDGYGHLTAIGSKTLTTTDIGAQPALVSGTNIKTINGSSILGGGELTVGDVTTTGVQTLTNKTATNLILDAGYTEEVTSIFGTAPALSPLNGSIQLWSMTGNSTPTKSTWNSGQSITLLVNDGANYTISWSSIGVLWKTEGGAAPTLNTASFTVIVLWNVAGTIYGARVGDA